MEEESPSGIRVAEDGSRFVGGSRRKDGTVRPVFKVKQGFIPVEDQERYVVPGRRTGTNKDNKNPLSALNIAMRKINEDNLRSARRAPPLARTEGRLNKKREDPEGDILASKLASMSLDEGQRSRPDAGTGKSNGESSLTKVGRANGKAIRNDVGEKPVDSDLNFKSEHTPYVDGGKRPTKAASVSNTAISKEAKEEGEQMISAVITPTVAKDKECLEKERPVEKGINPAKKAYVPPHKRGMKSS